MLKKLKQKIKQQICKHDFHYDIVIIPGENCKNVFVCQKCSACFVCTTSEYFEAVSEHSKGAPGWIVIGDRTVQAISQDHPVYKKWERDSKKPSDILYNKKKKKSAAERSKEIQELKDRIDKG